MEISHIVPIFNYFSCFPSFLPSGEGGVDGKADSFFWGDESKFTMVEISHIFPYCSSFTPFWSLMEATPPLCFPLKTLLQMACKTCTRKNFHFFNLGFEKCHVHFALNIFLRLNLQKVREAAKKRYFF